VSAAPVRSIHDVERRARLARRHHLARSVRICDVLSLAGDLVGLHSSSPSTVYLAAFARTITPSFEELERALYEDRTLLRVLGMRRTLFVVPRDLAAIVNAACAAKLAVGERTRLLGLIEKQGIAAGASAWLDGVEEETMAALRRRGQALATELTGLYRCVRAEALAMQRAGGGSIVNVSSIAGVLTHRWMTPYCVAKAGVNMLTRCAADELGPLGIRVNAVMPSLVDTPMVSMLIGDAGVRAEYLSRIPLNRLGKPEDVGGFVAALLSEESGWVTGQCIGVDGGHTLRQGPDLVPFFQKFLPAEG